MALRTYKAKIRLNVQANDIASTEVWKTGLTRAEILVLNRIHGPNSVVEITALPDPAMHEEWDDDTRSLKATVRTVEQERQRLAMTYSYTSQERPLPGPVLVNDVFGPPGMPHPAFDDAPPADEPPKRPVGRPARTIDPSELQGPAA